MIRNLQLFYYTMHINGLAVLYRFSFFPLVDTLLFYQYNKTRLRESILAGIRVPGDPHRDIDGVSVWGAAVAVTRACGSGGGGAPQANHPRCAATPRAVTQNVTRGAAK